MRYLELIPAAFLVIQAGALQSQSAIPRVVVVGKVREIKAAPEKSSKGIWLVKVSVQAVESGDYTDQSIQFRVHFPSKVGIQIDRRYRIRAEKIGGQYSALPSDIKEMP